MGDGVLLNPPSDWGCGWGALEPTKWLRAQITVGAGGWHMVLGRISHPEEEGDP